jgi:hypothetical protein
MPKLKWISDTDLKSAVQHLVILATKSKSDAIKNFNKNVVDPFSAVFEMSGFGMSYTEWVKSEEARQAQKSLQNHVGDFHQTILGSCTGWTNMKIGNNTGDTNVLRDLFDVLPIVFLEVIKTIVLDKKMLTGLFELAYGQPKTYIIALLKAFPTQPPFYQRYGICVAKTKINLLISINTICNYNQLATSLFFIFLRNVFFALCGKKNLSGCVLIYSCFFG